MNPGERIRDGKVLPKGHTEKLYKRGALIFIEGECSREMYIIRSGKVRVIRQEGEGVRELAVLGPGGVLGEVSLLDKKPRTATAQVIEDATVTVVDEALFQATIGKIPPWLARVVQLIVGRFRLTMKKAGDELVRFSISGVIRIILLLNQSHKKKISGMDAVPLQKLKETTYSVTGLGAMEVEEILFHLILKEMIVIRKDELQAEYVLIKNNEVLFLYMGYYRAIQGNTSLIGENFSESAYELINYILSACQNIGKAGSDSIVQLTVSQVESEIQRAGGEGIKSDALEQLLQLKVLFKEEDDSQIGMRDKNSVLSFKPAVLQRLSLLSDWLPVFREEICN
ncbi:Uncharacterized protein CHISP_3191 [Chitinispirillum alkaliphilum]|nr:Uncharacterized protein CHISP_3191 [Chitinispirillum alkaliphilum]